MAFELNKYRVDPSKVVDGVEVDIGGGAKLRIAQRSNKKFNEYLGNKVKPHRRAIDSKTIDGTLLHNIVADATAKFVLLGWTGIEEDGAALEYTYDNAYRLLTEERYAPFQQLVDSLAGDYELFGDAEEVAGK